MSSVSYIHGKTDMQMWYTTLPDLLDRRATETPDKDIHVFWSAKYQDRLLRESITYRDLAEGSYNVAAALLDLGLGPGDRVAIVADSCMQWLHVEYAVMRCKILMIRIPCELATAKLLAEYIADYSCKAVIVDGRSSDTATRVVQDLSITWQSGVGQRISARVIALKADPGSRLVSVTAMAEPGYAPSHRRDEVRRIQKAIRPDDVALVLTPSGTHGTLRFIKLSHFGIINNARFVDAEILNDPGSRYFNGSPFFWVGANLYAAVTFGITMVHLDKESQNDMRRVSAVLATEEVTVGKFMSSFLDTAYRMEMRGDHILPDTLRTIITGGAPLSDDETRYFQSNNRSVLQDYGTTETLTVAISLTTRTAPGVHFKPIPFVELKVEDNEERVLPIEKAGCLWVRSPYLYKGYLEKGKPDTNTHHGWYNTSDVARIRHNGCLEIIGRYCDVIKQGARIIYPSEVEREIRKLSCVRDVIAVGVPPQSSNQDICICVIAMETCENIVVQTAFDRMKAEWSLDYTIRYILILEKFPRVPDGKVNEGELMRVVLDHFGIKNNGIA